VILKVCRVKDLATARLCAQLSADFVGLHAILRLDEKRGVVFRGIARELGTFYPETRPVIVTRVTVPEELAGMVQRTGIEFLQIHAPVTPRDFQEIHSEIARVTGLDVRFFAVVAASDTSAEKLVATFARDPGLVQHLLIDSSWRGGTGQRASDDVLRALLDIGRGLRPLVAGGIDANNVEEFARLYQPSGFDVQSSLERSTPGRPKDPVALRGLSVLVKGTGRASLFLSPPQPRVSLSLTDVDEVRLSKVIRQFRTTDIDGIHLDYSDGSLAQGFVRDPIVAARSLSRLAPCLPYDVHLFVRDTSLCGAVLGRYKRNNTLMRVAYLHLQEDSQVAASGIHRFKKVCSELGVGCGIAFHAPRYTVNSLRDVLGRVRHIALDDLSLVIHSDAHGQEIYATHDLPLLRLLGDHATQATTRCHLTVDRDVTLAKLRVLGPGGVTHAVVGDALRRVPMRQRLISGMRQELRVPGRRRVLE
jgi:phosphoribosylanthranilate isomerase/pentose-5-phosphate-3-epimerase